MANQPLAQLKEIFELINDKIPPVKDRKHVCYLDDGMIIFMLATEKPVPTIRIYEESLLEGIEKQLSAISKLLDTVVSEYIETN